MLDFTKSNKVDIYNCVLVPFANELACELSGVLNDYDLHFKTGELMEGLLSPLITDLENSGMLDKQGGYTNDEWVIIFNNYSLRTTYSGHQHY